MRQDDESSSLALSAIPRITCDPHKSHVIVGGLGGFGLELAQWLVERGARYLVLTSPVGVCTGYQDRRIRQWQQAGVVIAVSTGDVTDVEETRTLIRDAVSMCRDGVGSVFNLAVILHDGLTSNQTPTEWARATKPKVRFVLVLFFFLVYATMKDRKASLELLPFSSLLIDVILFIRSLLLNIFNAMLSAFASHLF